MKITKESNCLNAAIMLSFLLFTTALIVLLIFEPVAYGQSPSTKGGKISKVDHWRYFKGNEMPPENWKYLGFNDTTWLRGHGKFGYGHSGLDTFLDDMRGKYLRLFARSEFIVNPETVSQMNLLVVCDGPFKAYINGIEVVRNDYKITESIDISGFISELLPGKNVLAIECSDDEINSNNFYFMPTLDIHRE